MSATVDAFTKGESDALDQSEIRRRFEAALAEDDKSVASAASEAGIGGSTLAAWKAHKYNGDNEKVAGQVSAWLTMREARKQHRATMPKAPDFQMTETARRIWNVLEHAQAAPDIAVISGGAGVGKTSAAQEYARRAANVWIATMEPWHNSPAALMQAVLNGMGQTATGRASLDSQAIRHRMKNSNGLLIIDETQHLPTHLLDQVRSWHDILNIGVAFMGNVHMNATLGIAGRRDNFAQLFSRIGVRQHIRRPLKADIEALMTAWGLEDSVLRREVLTIGQQPGGARGMTKMLRLASSLAGSEGRERVSLADVRVAWGQMTAQPDGGVS